MGDKVKSIGRNAFISNGGNAVASITCHAATPPVLGSSAFGSVGGTVAGKKYVYVPAESFDAYEKEWAVLTNTNGYIFEDISNQELTDGVWYRASREEEWTTSMPQSFPALYVRTVGENTIISAEAFAEIVAKISAQQTPVTLDLRSARYAETEFPAVLAGNAKLGAIKFFDNTAAVAAGAFKGCPALTETVIPTGVAEIGAETFEGCTALAAVNIPSSVTAVGAKAFNGCTALTDIALNSVKTIGTEAFAGSGLAQASVSAETLGERAFSNCVSLTSASLSKMTSIPTGCFAGCVKLAAMTIPNSVTEIGANAFDGCSALASATLGTGVKSLGASAFANCALTSLVLPDQLTTLGNGAFRNNPAIAKITFGAGIAAVGNNVFAGNANDRAADRSQNRHANRSGGIRRLVETQYADDLRQFACIDRFESFCKHGAAGRYLCRTDNGSGNRFGQFLRGRRFGTGREDRTCSRRRRLRQLDIGLQPIYLRTARRRLPERRRLLPCLRR